MFFFFLLFCKIERLNNKVVVLSIKYTECCCKAFSWAYYIIKHPIIIILFFFLFVSKSERINYLIVKHSLYGDEMKNVTRERFAGFFNDRNKLYGLLSNKESYFFEPISEKFFFKSHICTKYFMHVCMCIIYTTPIIISILMTEANHLLFFIQIQIVFF